MFGFRFGNGLTLLAGLVESGLLTQHEATFGFCFTPDPPQWVDLHAHNRCWVFEAEDIIEDVQVDCAEFLSGPVADFRAVVDGETKVVLPCHECFEDLLSWTSGWNTVFNEDHYAYTFSGPVFELFKTFPVSEDGRTALHLLLEKVAFVYAVANIDFGNRDQGYANNLFALSSQFDQVPGGLPDKVYELHAVVDEKVRSFTFSPAAVDKAQCVWVSCASEFFVNSSLVDLSPLTGFAGVVQFSSAPDPKGTVYPLLLVDASCRWQAIPSAVFLAPGSVSLEAVQLAMKVCPVPYPVLNHPSHDAFKEAVAAAQGSFV